MAHLVLLARAVDGLPLAEEGQAPAGGTLRQQTRQLLARLHSAPPRCSVASEDGQHAFHFVIFGGVCFLVLCDATYPRSFAFGLLEELRSLFQAELTKEFGFGAIDHRAEVEAVERPYRFVGFTVQITRKKAEYRDPGASLVLSRIQSSLTDVSGIARYQMDEILGTSPTAEQDIPSTPRSKVKEPVNLSVLWRSLGLAMFCILSVLILFVVPEPSLAVPAACTPLLLGGIFYGCFCAAARKAEQRESKRASQLPQDLAYGML